MSGLLRHRVGTRSLIPDDKGFVEFSRFMYAMKDEANERHAITEDEVIYVVTTTGVTRFAVRVYKTRSGVAARVRA